MCGGCTLEANVSSELKESRRVANPLLVHRIDVFVYICIVPMLAMNEIQIKVFENFRYCTF